MKILHIIHDFLPNARKGSELYAYYTAKRQKEIGHDVAIFHAEAGGRYRHINLVETEFETLKIYKIKRSFSNYFNIGNEKNKEINKSFIYTLEKFKPNIIHVHQLLLLSIDIPEIAKGMKIPVIYTLHDFWLICPTIRMFDFEKKICTEFTREKCVRCSKHTFQKFPIYESTGFVSQIKQILKEVMNNFYSVTSPEILAKLFRKDAYFKQIAKYVDLFIAPSMFIKALHVKYGIKESKIIYSDYGMNTSIFKKAVSKKVSLPLKLGFLGDCSYSKGLRVLLDAIKNLKDNEKVEVMLYGNISPRWVNKYYPELFKNKIIKINGYIVDHQKESVFNKMHLLVVPSVWYENSPLVIHEAFLTGTPVLTGNVGGMKDLIEENKSGITFEIGNSTDLANKIDFLLDNPVIVEEMSEYISENKLVKSISENVDELNSIYKELTNA